MSKNRRGAIRKKRMRYRSIDRETGISDNESSTSEMFVVVGCAAFVDDGNEL